MQANNLESRLRSNLKTRSPVRLAIKVYLIYFGILLLIPVKAVFPLDFLAICFFGLTVIFALAGLKLGSIKTIAKETKVSYGINFELLSKLIILISTIGIFLALTDRFLIRGVGISENALEARATIEGAGSGIISILAAFLSSFSAFGVISIWLTKHTNNKKYRILSTIAYVNLIIYITLSIMLSSRSLLLVIFVSHALAHILIKRDRNKKLSLLFLSLISFSTLTVLTALVFLFQSRLSLMGLSAIDSLQLSSYAYTLTPTKSVLNLMKSNEFLSDFGAATFSLILYVYHGMFEFFYLFTNLGSHHTYGSETFWLPLKFFEVIFGPFDRPSLDLVKTYRPGVFTTFAGPLFLDFSIATPVVAFVMFYFLSFPNQLAARGKLQWIFFSIITETIIIFSPIVSLFQSATGMYLIIAALCIGMFAPKIKIQYQ